MTRRFPDMRLTRDQWSTGDAIAAGIAMIVGICVIVFVIALLAASGVRAHDTGKGWSYPWECCHDMDCTEISEQRVKPERGGYLIDGRFHVPQSQVRFSPDGHYHACFPNPDQLRCFFAPPAGS